MSGPRVNPHAERIVMAHGGGGQRMDDLLCEVVFPRLGGPIEDDSAILPAGEGPIAFTTDGYVVQPLEFPGGDIGRLAVCGTVNDLAVCGAVPEALSLGLVLEEGLRTGLLARLLDSAAAAAEEAGVRIVTGDTKVVSRGQADGLYVTTAGVGRLREGVRLDPGRIRPGDVLLASGTIADHGVAVLLARQSGAAIRSDLESDTAPLAGLVGALLDAAPDTVFLRDPTRGGVAGVAADLAERSGRRLAIEEADLPVRRETRYAAEMLGLDVLDVANEGKVLAVVRPGDEGAALDALREHPLGRDAVAIGRFEDERDGFCELVTRVGGRRVVQKPYGEELPRIC